MLARSTPSAVYVGLVEDRITFCVNVIECPLYLFMTLRLNIALAAALVHCVHGVDGLQSLAVNTPRSFSSFTG